MKTPLKTKKRQKKYSMTHADEISIRKHKMEVSITNSFPFRARCSSCGGFPEPRVFRSTMYYSWETPQEYHKQGMNQPLSANKRVTVRHLFDVRRTHFTIHSMKMATFSKEPSRFMRRECWPRVVFCKCRNTHWTFNNATDLHSTRMFSLVKRK